MFSVINPWLLGGLFAVGAPILIHLLLRRRPQPLAWGAMRWLHQALERARRQMRLSQWLLLLLRCLLIACVVLAVARPRFAAWGDGGDLLLVVDRSASMGEARNGQGGLQALAAALHESSGGGRMRLVVLGKELRLIADGDPRLVRDAAANLQADPIPGGLDSLSDRADFRARLRGMCEPGTRVILVSDFRQDDGSQLATILGERAAAVERWVVGQTVANSHLRQAPDLPDLIAHQAASLTVDLAPLPDHLTVAIDDSAPVPLPLDHGGGSQRLDLPSLAVGEHRLRLSWSDRGLVDDDRLEIPLIVRPPLPVVVIDDRPDARMAIALGTDRRHTRARLAHPANLANEALPDKGLVVLHARPADGDRLQRWVMDGGVLWSDATTLAHTPGLDDLLPALASEERSGGPLRPGPAARGGTVPLLANALGRIDRDTIAALADEAEEDAVLLWAGNTPALIVYRYERGRVVLDLAGLSRDPGFWDRAVATLWARETVRDLLADRWQATIMIAGRSIADALELERDGQRVRLEAGSTLLLPPGIWRRITDGHPVLILPAPEEMNLQRPPLVRDGITGLPPPDGQEIGFLLAIVALLLLMTEGALAAWTGARHARAA